MCTTSQLSTSGEKENACTRRSDQTEDRDIKAQGRAINDDSVEDPTSAYSALNVDKDRINILPRFSG